MTAGFVYNLKPREVQEERHDVSTGIRRHGNYILGVAELEVGSRVPSFLLMATGLKARTARIVVRALVAETAGTLATKIRVAKNPYIGDGMTLGTEGNGATVQSIDRTSADYDEVILMAVFSVKVSIGDTLFEASAAGGTIPEAVANSALYENHKAMEGINSITLLTCAFKIEPKKLVMPFCVADEANPPYFQFSE